MRSVGSIGRSPVSSIGSTSISVASSTEDMLDNPEEYLCHGLSRHNSRLSNYDNMDGDAGMTTPVQSTDPNSYNDDDECSPPLPAKKSVSTADYSVDNPRLYVSSASDSDCLPAMLQQSVTLQDVRQQVGRHQHMDFGYDVTVPPFPTESLNHHSVSQQAVYSIQTTQTAGTEFEPQSNVFSSSMLSHSSKSVAVRSVDSGYLSSASQQHFSIHAENHAVMHTSLIEPPLPPKFKRS